MIRILPPRLRRGFTLTEILLTLGLVGALGLALLMFTSTSARFIARNLATNHSHESTRTSALTLLSELHDSASSFRLVRASNGTFTDVTPTPSSETDELTGQTISTRANGVRFRRYVGGPYPLAANTVPTHTQMTFDFRTDPDSTFVPVVGDKLVLPLISREYDVTAVSGSFSPNGTVTVTPAVGFTLSTGADNIVTGYFYRRAAFTVENQELRFHDNFTGSNRANFRVIRTGVTSPMPFSLLYLNPSDPSTDALNLRVSMEMTDLGYSARRFGNGSTTLYTIYPPRMQPTAVSSSN